MVCLVLSATYARSLRYPTLPPLLFSLQHPLLPYVSYLTTSLQLIRYRISCITPDFILQLSLSQATQHESDHFEDGTVKLTPSAAMADQHHRTKRKQTGDDQQDKSACELVRKNTRLDVQQYETGSTYGQTVINDKGVGILGNIYNSEVHVSHHHHYQLTLPPLLEDPILIRIAQTQLELLEREIAKTANVSSGEQTSSTLPLKTFEPYDTIGTDVYSRLQSLEAGLEDADPMLAMTTHESHRYQMSYSDCEDSMSETTFVTCLPGTERRQFTFDLDLDDYLDDAQSGAHASVCGDVAGPVTPTRRDEMFIALMGQTGAGKSTFIQQITRQHDFERNEIQYSSRVVIGVDYGWGTWVIASKGYHWATEDEHNALRVRSQWLVPFYPRYLLMPRVHPRVYSLDVLEPWPDTRTPPLLELDKLIVWEVEPSPPTCSPGQSQKAVTLLDRATPCSVESNTDFCTLTKHWVGLLLSCVSVLVLHSLRSRLGVRFWFRGWSSCNNIHIVL